MQNFIILGRFAALYYSKSAKKLREGDRYIIEQCLLEDNVWLRIMCQEYRARRRVHPYSIVSGEDLKFYFGTKDIISLDGSGLSMTWMELLLYLRIGLRLRKGA